MILVDTSVWIDFLIGRETIFRKELHRLIEGGTEIAVNGIILQEILQGLRSDLECKQVEKNLAEFRYLTLNEPDIFRNAATIYRHCAHRGRKIRKPVDALIAAHAISFQIELFHNDRDFNQIAAVAPLKIYQASKS